MEQENINGKTVEYIKGNGKTIKCMEKVSLNGQMVEFILDNITWIKSKD